YHSAALSSLLAFDALLQPNHRALRSFPTRRSSDLVIAGILPLGPGEVRRPGLVRGGPERIGRGAHLGDHGVQADLLGEVEPRQRSEEHTSELQSRFDLVCRLLLEKKKQQDLMLSSA